MQTFKSKFHNAELKITGYDEPNNGRMLHVAELWINGVNKTKEFFDYGLYLDFELKNYIMDSLDGKFIFIPEEGGGVLIEMIRLEKIKLPYKGISTVTFRGNTFTESMLTLNHSDMLIQFDLLQRKQII
jgi:hypothetical protein